MVRKAERLLDRLMLNSYDDDNSLTVQGSGTTHGSLLGNSWPKTYLCGSICESPTRLFEIFRFTNNLAVDIKIDLISFGMPWEM